MKRTLLLLNIAIFCCFKLFSQSPQYVPYQAVARNSAGNLLVNQAVSLRFTVHQSTSGGTTQYQETQSATTNNLGLFSVNVGAGTVVSGTFSGVTWSDGNPKFLQVEIDPTGGTSYVSMGATQMMSVPYALYAGSVPAGSLTGTVPVSSGGTGLTTALTSGQIDIGNSSGGFTRTTLTANSGVTVTNGSGSIGIGETLPFTTLTTSGSSGSASISSGTLNIPAYTLSGLGGISGSGTSGYTARFTGSTAIGNGAIQDNGSQVGIGAAPNTSYELYVNGNIQANTTYQTTSGYGKIMQVGDDAWINDVNIANTMGVVGNETSSNGGIQLGTGSGAYFYSNGTANIGLNTTSPNNTLSVNGSGGFWNSNQLNFYTDGGVTPRGFVGQNSSGSDMMLAAVGSGQWMRIGSNSANIAFFPDNTIYSGSSPKVVISSAGYIGVNTTGPGYPIDVETSASQSFSSMGYLNSAGSTGHGNTNGNQAFSIYASGRIACSEFDAVSDARIKKDRTPSDSRADLETLLAIQPVSFKYIDEADHGPDFKKGFIAQEIMKVMPEAVQTNPGFIPSVYQMSTAVSYNAATGELKIRVAKPHGLKVGDKIKTMTAASGKIVNVVSVVNSETEFTLAGWQDPTTSSLMVYGVEVPDFHTVDYDRIYTLNVSATQELAKQLAASQLKNEVLEHEIALLKNANCDLTQKVDALSSNTADIQLMHKQLEDLKSLMEKNGIRSDQ